MSDETARPADGPFVTRLEAARVHLRCDVTTIDRRVADGSLPRFKFGRRTLFRLSDVMSLVVPSPGGIEQAERLRSMRKSRGSTCLPDDARMAAALGLALITVVLVAAACA